MHDDPDFISVEASCRLIGGDKPISKPTYYRGVARGIYPEPEHPSPGIARVRRGELIAALNRGRSNGRPDAK